MVFGVGRTRRYRLRGTLVSGNPGARAGFQRTCGRCVSVANTSTTSILSFLNESPRIWPIPGGARLARRSEAVSKNQIDVGIAPVLSQEISRITANPGHAPVSAPVGAEGLRVFALQPHSLAVVAQ